MKLGILRIQNIEIFYDIFNTILEAIQTADPNHPVTTTLSRHQLRKSLLSIQWHSPNIDFISINIFGKLKDITKDLKTISWLWNQPYLISEWGINGPWEVPYTAWSAPIEPTSTKKAAQIKERYSRHIKNLSNNCLGNLVFYWGQKQETTHTWFSILDNKGAITEAVSALSACWNPKIKPVEVPQIEYMLLEKKGALDNCVFTPNTIKQAEIYYTHSDSTTIDWEIYPENWAYYLGADQTKPPKINGLITNNDKHTVTFRTPSKEGAYRIFASVYDAKGNVATTNTPFYVLKSSHE